MAEMTTLTKASKELGVTRQGVYDFLKKNNKLADCEQITGDDGKVLMLRFPARFLDGWTPRNRKPTKKA